MNKLFATALMAAAFVFAASAIAQKAAPAAGDSTQPNLTKEEQAKAKADAKAKKEAQAKMTPEEKKAANAAKVKQEKESAKDTTNKP
jgi:uncharacterized membrane protein YhiD involved in acid resistance